MIQAVGKDKARDTLKEYIDADFLNNVLNPNTRTFDKAKAARWLGKNISKLKKLGLYDEYRGITKLQAKADALKDKLDVFNKSIAGKVLGADVDKVIDKAFSTTTNIRKSAEELYRLVKDDKAALEGARKAFADFLERRSITSQPSFFQQEGADLSEQIFNTSVANMIRNIRKYKPVIDVLYRDEPKRKQALYETWKGFEILSRNLKSSIGGGSDTFENLMQHTALGALSAKIAPRAYYMFVGIRNLLMKYSEDKVNLFLLRSMIDPEYAEVLQKIARRRQITPAMDETIRNMMTRITVAEALDKNREEK